MTLQQGQLADESQGTSLCSVAPCKEGTRLARYLRTRHSAETSEARTDACLGDLVDDGCLTTMHLASNLHRPDPARLLEGLPAAHRLETLVWLLQAFDVMYFTDSLLYDAALLLDRYYARLPREEGAGGAQKKLLAAVCTVLKTGAPVEMQIPIRQVINHLGREQVRFEDVLKAELGLLAILGFEVGTPTALDFFDALSTRLHGECARVGVDTLNLGMFLLQLTLSDATLHYRYPHAILATSALVLALHTMQCPVPCFVTVMEDLSLYFGGGAGTASALVLRCCATIHQLWKENANGSQEQSTFARHLFIKFSRANRSSVSELNPPLSPPSSIPETSTVPQGTSLSPPLVAVAAGPALQQAKPVFRDVTNFRGAANAPREGYPQAPLPRALSGVTSASSLGYAEKSSGLAAPSLAGAVAMKHNGVLQTPFDEAIMAVRQCIASNENLMPEQERMNNFKPSEFRSAFGKARPSESEWSSSLATLLRGLVENSPRLRSILTRHGWAGNQFRRPPCREQLLQDLLQGSRTSTEKARTLAAASVAGTAERRRRAASWCGQRSSTRISGRPLRSP